MRKSGISLFNETAEKRKPESPVCDICTGCGRCLTDRQDIHILADGIGRTKGEARTAERPADEMLIGTDIGTTTIAMVLYAGDGRVMDSFAKVNPQIKYGRDVLSRIRAAEEGAAREMQKAVLQVLEQGIAQFRRKYPGQMKMVIAANTTMLYLLRGQNPEELGRAPFTASHLEASTMTIGGIETFTMPGLSCFVGADILAGIYACGMAEQEEMTLLLDLGTNGEMVLGNRHGMTACSTAAGPAFEGMCARGIWGADMVALIAALCRQHILDDTGLMAETYFDKGVRIGGVPVSQQDVRSFQLAKGAVAAGIRTLVQQHGLASVKAVDKVILAGGFGYYLNPEAAGEVGLIPYCLTGKTVAAGNTALQGARLYGSALPERKAQADAKMAEIIQKTTVINLAEYDSFQEMYMEAMGLEQW